MRILFMGTSEFAVPALKELIIHNLNSSVSSHNLTAPVDAENA